VAAVGAAEEAAREGLVAELYGMVLGKSSPATRPGTRESGIRTTAQSWKGTVGVEFRYLDDQIMCEIAVAPDSRAYPRQVLYFGPLETLIQADSLEPMPRRSAEQEGR